MTVYLFEAPENVSSDGGGGGYQNSVASELARIPPALLYRRSEDEDPIEYGNFYPPLRKFLAKTKSVYPARNRGRRYGTR
ncbi:hypothetical protein, partial [Erythrobacter sp. YJ-T3-07]|uniref:hypothetical protein n=1 Tax=Erythrobacter sp. YJ-T3-07 TaxID=2793063 RepID=UPI001F2EBF2D